VSQRTSGPTRNETPAPAGDVQHNAFFNHSYHFASHASILPAKSRRQPAALPGELACLLLEGAGGAVLADGRETGDDLGARRGRLDAAFSPEFLVTTVMSVASSSSAAFPFGLAMHPVRKHLVVDGMALRRKYSLFSTREVDFYLIRYVMENRKPPCRS